MKDKVLYINIKYLLITYCGSDRIDNSSSNFLRRELEKIDIAHKSLVVFDMKTVKFSSSAIDIEQSKKSALYFSFKNIVDRSNTDFLYVNATEEIVRYLTERDFLKQENIFAMSFYPERLFQNGLRPEYDKKELYKRWSFLTDFSFLDKENDLRDFVDQLVSFKVESFILSKGCIKDIEEKEHHILKSTPVHVNKYVDIKPILEDFKPFSEICFLLSESIKSKINIPDYIVAPSKNAMSIASGVLRYLKPTDLIIINQISPITKLDNYSNIDSINPNARYAIIEDFLCMGTEIKVVKGILWSHGVNIDEDVHAFPIACAQIYDKDCEGGSRKQKVYPLYKLEENIDYMVFTHNTCPVCNSLDCNHRKFFRFNI